MNRFFSYLAGAVVTLTSFALSSCGDNDESKVSAIVGTWQYDKDASSIEFGEESSDNNIFGETVTFKEDGTFTATNISGTYTLNDHDFAISYKKGGKTYSIKKGEDIFDVVAEEVSEEEKNGMEMIEDIATVTVDDCKADFDHDDNQLIVTLTITKDIDLGDLDEKELGVFKDVIDAFKGQSTQTLVFNKKQ